MSNTRFFVSDFVEIQRNSFNSFLEKGIISEITRRNPIYVRRDNSSIFEIRFYPEYYRLTTPINSVEKAIRGGKSYTSDFFLPIQLTVYELGIECHNIAIDLTTDFPSQLLRSSESSPRYKGHVDSTGAREDLSPPKGLQTLRGLRGLRGGKGLTDSPLSEGPSLAPEGSSDSPWPVTPLSPLRVGESESLESVDLLKTLRDPGGGGKGSFGLKIKRTCFQWINLCQFPLMTKRGHFIINGSPRVIVNQVLRSPGIYFQQKEYQTFHDQWTLKPKEVLMRYYTDIICFRGTWLRIAVDRKNRMWAQTKRHPKIPLYCLLLAMGLTLRQLSNSLSNPERILENFSPEAISSLALRNRLQDTEGSRRDSPSSDSPFPPKGLQTLRGLHTLPLGRVWNSPTHRGGGRVGDQVLSARLKHLNFQWIENPPEAWELIYEIQNPNNSSNSGRVPPQGTPRDGESVSPLQGPPGHAARELTNGLLADSIIDSISSNQLDNMEKGRQWVFNKFMNPRTYELRKQGRTNINKKFKLNIPFDQQTLTAQDLLATTEYLIQIEKGLKTVDNIDHLKNRRVRTVGELIQVQFGIGLLRFEKYVRTSLNLEGISEIFERTPPSPKPNYRLLRLESPMKSGLLAESSQRTQGGRKSNESQPAGSYVKPSSRGQRSSYQTSNHSGNDWLRKPGDIDITKLLSNSGKSLAKPVNGALREFFGTSPLSQLMDQMNPLAELTHKRRLTSLGPGGVSRDNATLDIRGIHPSHYGRICPIETPEGKNTGLVNSITTYAFVNETGTIETPYFRMYKGQIQKEAGFFYLTAEKEDFLTLAAGDVGKSTVNFFPKKNIPIRQGPRFTKILAKDVHYIAISAIQMISVAASLIPFLEHDDANRALMGSNMQRQSVPLLRPTRPIVATGLESKVIADSGHVIQAKYSGIVTHVSGSCIQLYSLMRPY
jgi:DNA-directed RNA polymerase beta subunit